MNKNCKKCGSGFDIFEEDLKVFEKVSPVINDQKYLIPEPTFCPDCRQQRRLAFRNERSLYSRKCDMCTKDVISNISTESDYKVYCSDCYWGDKWDPTSYGKDFDFNRPFFEQYEELMKEVPIINNIVNNSTNCEYNSFCVYSKNCYMSSRLGNAEDIYYSYLALDSLGCYDCFNIYKSHYCYECVDCWSCYNCKFCRMCKNTNDSAFCYDCIGCKDCFGCVGLRNCEYYVFNKKYSKEEYEKLVEKYYIGKYSSIESFKKSFKDLIIKNPVRSTVIIHSQNAQGDYISDSKNIYNGFDIEATEDCRNTWGAEHAEDIYDGSFIYFGINCYEMISNSKSSNINFSFIAFGSNDLMYSMLCFNNTHDCFGCFSLNHKEYCVLNKQYTKEEYETLVPKIIEHMKKTGEYGEFFPASLSLFGYNETFAQNYFPLSKDEVIKKGYKWREIDKKDYKPQTFEIPNDIKDVSDNILNEILACEDCEKNFKIIKQELEFYKKHELSIPHKCPVCRHNTRLNSRNPRKLWDRKCGKCSLDIKSSYSPERPEKVYCEKCYLEAVV